ncbi:MAG: response regulator [Armatimonadota bacterium]
MTRMAGKDAEGTILLIDDEPSVASAVRDLLGFFGYQVFIASGGEEAIDFFRERSEEVNLIILDLMMPDMGGEECLKQLRSICPDVPTIISSGYLGGSDTEELLNCEIQGILAKPFSPETLKRVVNEALGS